MLLVIVLAVSLLPRPRSRVRVICNCLLLAMSTENLLLALGRGPGLWCLGAVIAWLGIPVMNANMEALLRSTIPVELQGRVYAARNTLQFFTIPLGSLLSGVLIDRVLEPFMARQGETGLLVALFGTGKGSGAALLFLALVACAFSCILGAVYLHGAAGDAAAAQYGEYGMLPDDTLAAVAGVLQTHIQAEL